MNNARFGTLANLYHRPRQPMQGGMPMQAQPAPQGQQGQTSLGSMLSAMQQQMGVLPRQQRTPSAAGSSGMNAIIAQLMQRGR